MLEARRRRWWTWWWSWWSLAATDCSLGWSLWWWFFLNIHISFRKKNWKNKPYFQKKWKRFNLKKVCNHIATMSSEKWFYKNEFKKILDKIQNNIKRTYILRKIVDNFFGYRYIQGPRGNHHVAFHRFLGSEKAIAINLCFSWNYRSIPEYYI